MKNNNNFIVVFTPSGKEIMLPKRASSVDFAYALSSNIGNSCVASRINMRLAPLSEELLSGCTVEILTASDALPNPSWLSYVQTDVAKARIYEHLHSSEEGFNRYLIYKNRVLEGAAPISLNLNPLTSRIKELAKSPHELYELKPREFEELVAELLQDMGHEVILTPQTRDKGRDILAVYKTPVEEYLTIIDCKKYAAHRPIGPEPIQRLLWVADREDKASRAMIATTSRFTKGAIDLSAEYRWRLSLKDFDDIHEWLRKYGYYSDKIINNLWGYSK